MNATVTPHPALLQAERLAGRIKDQHREVRYAEDWYWSLHGGTRLAEEWNPDLACIYGGQDIAVEEAWTALCDARRELAELEEQANGTAAMVRQGGNTR